jgi:hypothetical protein
MMMGRNIYAFIITALPYESQSGKYGAVFSSENFLNAAFTPL